MSRIVIVILIYHHHKRISSINLLCSWRSHNVFPVRYEQTYRVELSFKYKTRYPCGGGLEYLHRSPCES
jgi:hypothetical protein